MKPSKLGRSRTDDESLIEMMALLALGARVLTAFKDMNSTDFSMENNCGWGYRLAADFARVHASTGGGGGLGEGPFGPRSAGLGGRGYPGLRSNRDAPASREDAKVPGALTKSTQG